MKRFYLTGQLTFGNRGCEAIVKSTLKILELEFGDVQLLVPSNNIQRDTAQLDKNYKSKIEFTPVYYYFLSRLWGLILSKIPSIKNKNFPLGVPLNLKKELNSVDAVLSIGGDNYTFEGRFPVWVATMDRYAFELGKPVFLWGASVGPFPAGSDLFHFMGRHLTYFRRVMVREKDSFDYLTKNMVLKNVIKTSDSAFHLNKEKVELNGFWPQHSKNGIIGFNISPLVDKLKNNNIDILLESVLFLEDCIKNKGLSIILIPHVTPLNNHIKNNDFIFMEKMYIDLRLKFGEYVAMCPDGYNSGQTKYIISKCQYLFAARTHATIAGFSTGVPTVSIAYSRKAIGLNKEIFKTDDWVLRMDDFNFYQLESKLASLMSNEDEIKKILHVKSEILRESTKYGTKKINGDI
jgi:colanic acid/amylovoran biosynthesis protein